MKKQKIVSYLSACKSENINPVLPDFSNAPARLRNALTAHYKLCIIVQAINKNDDGTQWEPDWTDTNQPKYVPRFKYDVKKSRFVFWYTNYVFDYGCDTASAAVGSCLCFRRMTDADYAAQKFEKLYSDYLKAFGKKRAV